MFQLTYRLKKYDDFLHQISQFGAHFVSKGPETETYFKTNKFQLRLEEGINHQLIMIKKIDHYQEIINVDIQQYAQLREMLLDLHGEKIHLTKQVVRYYLKDVLIEIYRYEKIGNLVILQAHSIAPCKNLARQLSLEEKHRLVETSADLAIK